VKKEIRKIIIKPFIFKDMLPAWLSFIIIISLVMVLSKYELGVILSLGAVGFAILAGANIVQSLINVVTDPTILLLIIIVTLIPVLGGIMEESGLMMEMIQKMRVSRKASLMIIPALFGLLPVPGGALMSAPIVEQIDSEEESSKKVSINVWYRHMLILIYPLSSSLILASILTNINLYMIVLGLLPCLIIMWVVGYFTLVKDISPFSEQGERDLKRAFHNMLPIIIAPIIDFIGRTFFDLRVPEIFLLVALSFSVLLALRFGNMKFSGIKSISKRMKIWRFPLIIFSMFIFLEVFILSGAPEEIASLNLSVFLLILIGFFLGFATGRIQLPVSILIPIYLVQNAVLTMPLLDFIFIYVSISLGYLITPIHPCVSYSTDYFETDFKKVVKTLGKPIIFSFLILIGVYWLLFLI
jgi:integral membrane protein (TIGR00529 family)